ncbi:hypothetical protein QBC43DRAFT_298522 [Cladorrhinum sp. PSN259]|nr:hypothetical protein QBC43DRAFT_298522 [Cladorrhinum sp. PSN259]
MAILEVGDRRSIGCIAVMITIFVTLHKFDKHPTSDWSFDINLNTLTALLATILRAALIYPAAQIISQEKWGWFASSRQRLSDLDAFENGSRGPWGALLLSPLIFKHRPLTMLGILIIVLSLGVGSFVQQASRTDACSTEITAPTSNTFIPVVRNLTRFFTRTEEVLDGIPQGPFSQDRLRFESKVSLFRPGGDESAVRASCSSPSCRYPKWGLLEPARPGWMIMDNTKKLPVTHASMGVCSSCVDVSSTATGSIRTSNGTSTAHISLPPVFELSGERNFTRNGLSIDFLSSFDPSQRLFRVLDIQQLNFMYNPQGQDLDLRWLEDLLDHTTGYPGIGSFIMNSSIGFISIMAMSRAPCSSNPQPGQSRCLPKDIRDHLDKLETKSPANAGFAASTCVLYPCLRTYNGEVTDGIFNQLLLGIGVGEIIRERNYALDSSDTSSFGLVQTPCRISNNNYGAGNITMAPGERPERPMTLTKSGKDLSDYPKECVYVMTTAFEQFLYDENIGFLTGDCSTTKGGIVCSEEPFVSLLGSDINATHDFIDTHMSSFALSISNKLRMEQQLLSEVSGKAFYPDVCFVVDRRWLLFPAVLTLLAATLLIVVLLPIRLRDEVPVWKDSLLPLVLQGDHFDGLRSQTFSETGHTTGMLLDINDLEEKANNLHVRLTGTVKGVDHDSDRNALLEHN